MKDYEQIEQDYAVFEKILNTLNDFAQEYLDEFEKFGDARLEDTWIAGGKINIKWSNNVYLESGSNYMESTEVLPVDYLWNPDWAADLHDFRFKENIEGMRVRELRIAEQQAADKETRHQQYLTLKEEFGG